MHLGRIDWSEPARADIVLVDAGRLPLDEQPR